MAYDNHAFCWHGVVSTDTERALAFYPEVLPWTVQKTPMGDGEATMLAAGGIPRLHLSAPQPGVPSHFEHYLRVEDVDASTRSAEANGGRVLVPPTDIPPGRFSVVTSPSGAPVALFHEADAAAAQNPPAGPGAIHWTELWSKDLDADLRWLKGTFGFEIEEMPMPDGPYHILKSGGLARGGAMASTEANAPAMWLAWVQVDEVDATVDRVSRHGGTVIAPAFDVPQVGRMAIVADPTGAVFGVITPA